ncbi:hypothetical protein BJV82DRAFT_670077 [Fennellomyces sp. T-0311]|nr:hypothetical protein BJV82DRAFT_670077 [Fennellomyces sp. T-0311]
MLKQRIQVIRSLQSVKHDCLIALDSLLKCIVVTLPLDGPATYDGSIRRKSDSALPSTSLLGSIAHNTKRISQMGTVEMIRSESAPCATMCDVRRALSSQQQVFSLLDRSKEYHLCYALAALLCNVYRVLELASAENDDDDEEEHATTNVYQRLREKMWAFRRDQQFPRMSELWTEMDQLMDAVYCLGYERCHAPPAYTDLDEEEYIPPPPPYVSEKTQYDLDNLFAAIDRLSHVAPRLNNQRVDMTERQANELAAASIGKIVDRLSLGRMNDQRATLPKCKDAMLRDLIVQICHVASRSFDNQRVSLDTRLQKKIDAASMHGLFDRMDRGRMADQEWKSPDERLFREMSGMVDSLVKSLHRPRFSKQRFQMTANKERDMFMSDLFSKVDRLEGRRLENQDAYIRPLSAMPSPPPSPRTLEDDEEIFELFDHMAQLQLTNQRAIYRGPSVKSSA